MPTRFWGRSGTSTKGNRFRKACFALSAIGQRDGRGAGQRRFAHAAFAGEKEEASGAFQKREEGWGGIQCGVSFEFQWVDGGHGSVPAQTFGAAEDAEEPSDPAVSGSRASCIVRRAPSFKTA